MNAESQNSKLEIKDMAEPAQPLSTRERKTARRRPLSLLFCIKAMNNPGGGAERVLAEVANGLTDRGHKVSVLTFEQPGGRSFYDLDNRIERIDLGVGSTTRPASIQGTVLRVRRLRSLIKSRQPNVAIGFMHSMFVPLGLALMRTGIPVIGSEHIVPEHYRTRPLEALLVRATPPFVSALTCVSQQVKELYPPQLKSIMRVLPNPISVTVVGRADPKGSPSNPKILLAVGRLSAQKDHMTLIDAFHAIATSNPDWTLRIVGDGELRQQLQAQISELNLSDRVDLAGSVRNVSAEYANSHLFVMPSLYESFGLTVIEAAAHGLPIIAFSDCAGINKLVLPGHNGLLVDPAGGRVAALATALQRLMQDDDLRVRLGSAAFAIPTEHELSAVLDSWENLAYDCLE